MIVGYERQRADLLRAIRSGRIPNAYLFSGPRGVGKHLIAQWFAAAVLCQQSNRPCGECTSCHKVEKEQHPDIFSLSPSGDSIKIGDIRSLTARLQFHPLEGVAKIVVIDDADTMTEGASNALLKTLEEPPPVTHFLLVTPHPLALPATIRSRCQMMVFPPLSEKIITNFLATNRGMTPTQAARAARLALGSLGKACSIDVTMVDQILTQFLSILSKHQDANLLTLAEEWAGLEDHAPLVLDTLTGLIRDAWVTCDVGPRVSVIHQGLPLPPLSHHHLDHAMTALVSARARLETSANKQLLFEELLFTLSEVTLSSR